MRKKILLFSLAMIFFAGCSLIKNEEGIEVELDPDRTARVFLEEEIVDGQRVLVIDYKSDKTAVKEETVAREVEKIWNAARPEADRRGISDALIKYRQPDPEIPGGKEYMGLLFEAEKIENGTWKLRKVN